VADTKGKIMGVYYHLLNDTKRESVHLGCHIKRGPLTQNEAVHFALCNYMMVNLGDALRLCGDTTDEGEDYADVDLLTYKFGGPEVIVKIVELLNAVYGREKYAVVDGVGVERA
jgi:hypothetical protein